MLYLNGRGISVGKFPNGESYADIPDDFVKSDFNKICLRFETDTDILFLQFLKDFVDEKAPNSFVTLELPYIPYSRMDRKEESRLFTLKSFAKLLNRMNFQQVIVMEPHSEVSVALIDRVKVLNTSAYLAITTLFDVLGVNGTAWLQKKTYDDVPEDFTLDGLIDRAKKAGVYFVYPDAGAEKRYRKQIPYPNVITCSKVRDFNTGNIQSITINDADSIKDCKVAIIVDDLCSKGGTFVGTAQALRKAIPTLEKIILVVTHCEPNIFNGTVLTDTDIDAVYTTSSLLCDRYDIMAKLDVKRELVNGFYQGFVKEKYGKLIIEDIFDVERHIEYMK